MNFDELKSNWQEAGGSGKSQSELQLMTKVRNHPKLKRLRIKFIIEVVSLVILLSVYYNAFDGGMKPLWINILLGASIGLFILNDVIGYFVLKNPIGGENVQKSLTTFIQKLKQLSIYSTLANSFFGGALIFFLTSNIEFTSTKYLILAGMIGTLLILMGISYRNWQSQISHFQRISDEFVEK